MVLTRRQILLGISAVGSGVACAGTGAQGARSAHGLFSVSAASDDNAPTILVCMPDTRQTRDVWSGLVEEIRGEFKLVGLRIDGSGAVQVIGDAMARHRPSAVILMNNPTVAAYRAWQRAAGDRAFPPSVILMTSFLGANDRQIVASTGITYEVPLITVVTNLRLLIENSVERVGVVYRSALEAFVQREADLAAEEEAQVVRELVGDHPNTSELKRAIRELKKHCDAIWVLNDNQLLTPHLIRDAWLPGLEERPWVPVIVGADSLILPTQAFGTFAVLPDHAALGVQAASLIFDIADEDWSLPAGGDVRLPLSTVTLVDLPQVRERFELREGAMRRVDHILGRE